MDYQKIFSEIHAELEKIDDPGIVASYIPELGNVDPIKFGVHLTTVDDQHFGFGDSNEKFSIQSISKVLSLVMAYQLEHENLWLRVGVEPPGTPFNSLLQLEYDAGIPRNPLINAGALVICDILVGKLNNPKVDFLEFVRKLAGNVNINYNSQVAESEKATSFRNAAAINLIKSFGNIKNDVNAILDLYAHLCSIEMTCKELSRTFMFFATDGIAPYSQERVISVSKSKRLNAMMQLCGFYDQAGEFSFKVGLPGKSGVGGGIVAILPDQYTIAVWSPKLNTKGNSYKGLKFLEMFTTKTGYSIF